MSLEECLDGFESKLNGIVDIYEQCEVCGGFLYDEFGRSLKRNHIECRRLLAEERRCDY